MPRALLFYNYYPLWKEFFTALGAEVVVSAATTKEILDQGIKQTVDEACLPVKVFYGHVLDLQGKVDYLFIPRMVSVQRKEYTCPKLLGIPDMIATTLPNLPPILAPCINLHSGYQQTLREIVKLGQVCGGKRLQTIVALHKALQKQKAYRGLLARGIAPPEAIACLETGQTPQEQTKGDLRIALIGHGYNIYDAHVSMNLLQKLRRMGAQVYTQDMLCRETVEAEAAKLPKAMFWTFGKEIIGATYHFLKQKEMDGIIYLTAFGCGPDSLVGELMEREAQRRKEIPFMLLTIDEHTGEAGLQTRLEAFIDMIKWRNASENNISAYGNSVYSL